MHDLKLTKNMWKHILEHVGSKQFSTVLDLLKQSNICAIAVQNEFFEKIIIWKIQRSNKRDTNVTAVNTEAA